MFWSAPQVELAPHFDRVLVMKGGRLAAQGSVDDLGKSGDALAESMAAE